MDEIKLMIIGSDNKSTGGIPRYIPEQLRHLPSNVNPTVYDIGAPEGSGWRWFLVSFVLAMRDALLFPFEERPDVVHIHTSHAYSFYRSSYYALFAAYIWRVPVLLHIHGSAFDEFVVTDSSASQILQRTVYRAVDQIIVLSSFWKDLLALHVSEEKIRVIPNAIDPGDYDPVIGSKHVQIVFISNLIERKGIIEFAEATERILRNGGPDVRINIAGKGPQTDVAESLAAAYDEVEYHGYVSEDQKRELLNEGSLYVLPTYAEGLPIAILEAMAGGNAIVSTPVGSIPEVISEENGELVPPGDVDALADTLIRTIEAPDDLFAAATTNRQTVESRYAWDVVMGQLVETYTDAIAKSQ